MPTKHDDVDEYIVRGKPIQPLTLTGNVSQLLLDAMKKNSTRIAQVDPINNIEVTHGELRERSIRVALEMRKRGVKAGDSVTVCGKIHLEVSLPALATLYLGATLNTIHPTYSRPQYKRVLQMMEPKMIFCEACSVKDIVETLNELKMKSELIVFGRDMEPFLERHVGESNFQAEHVNPETTLATVLCTSGTTGLFKGVPSTHAAFYISINEFIKYGSPDEVILVYSPICWGSGLKTVAKNILIGGKQIITEYIPEQTLEIMHKYRVTYAMLRAPKVLEMFEDPRFKRYNIPSHVRFLLFSGVASTWEQMTEIRNVFKNSYVFNGYGSTEMSSVHAFFDMEDQKALNIQKVNSVGKLFVGIHGKIVDFDTNQPQKRNVRGEICLKGPAMAKGYYKDPEATAEAFDSDGWFHTGDVGYFDDDDCLYIVGRNKDMLKYKAWHISPLEIEQILVKHPSIEAACVIGKPDVNDGDLPCAFVVKKPDTTLTEEEVIQYVKENVAEVQQLRGGVRFIDALPMTATGKVRRPDLKKMLE